MRDDVARGVTVGVGVPSEIRQDTLSRPSRRAVLAGVGAMLAAPAVRANAQSREISIAIASTSFATAPARAAVELGCFSRNGLSVTMPILDSASIVTSALISGSQKLTLGGSAEHVAAVGRGQPIVALTNVYWGQSGTLILAKSVADGTGVSPKAPVAERFKALDGLTIASVSATSSFTASFKGAAEAFGVKLNFVYMGQPSMIAALETGAIKGYIASAPLWGRSVTSGKGVEWISAPKGDLPDANVPRASTAFQTMRPFAEANPDLMRLVLNSYRDFSHILETNPGRVRAAMSKIYPDVDSATMDLLFEAEHRVWRMRDINAADMQHEIDFIRASGTPIAGLDKIDPASMIYVPPK